MSTDIAGTILFGKTRRGLLRLLFSHPDESFHLRQLVRLSGCGVGPVQRELAQLAQAGIVQRQRVGVQVMFKVNASSPIYAELRGLLLKTAGLADVLREALA
jgi:predicted transcriptional regulator